MKYKGIKMKIMILSLWCLLGVHNQSMSTDVINRNTEHDAKAKSNFSETEWENIIKNSKPPKKSKVKEIDQKNDIIYLENDSNDQSSKGHK